MESEQKSVIIRICVTVFLALSVFFISENKVIVGAILLLAYLIIGYDVLWRAIRGIFRMNFFDENFLMSIATLGAISLAVYDKSYDFTEAVAVMFFYQTGELFQSYAVGKSRKSIRELMDIRPDFANIEKDGGLVSVMPDDVETGSIIIVRPGERIPIDGIVTDGSSCLDMVALTGESLPRNVCVGDEVISGCVNLTGVLKIRTTKAFGESTASKIIQLVEESGLYKSKREKFISKFSRVYTPTVCIASVALAVLPPIVCLILGILPQWSVWIYRALIFLVISCPCALVISVPLTFFSGIGGAGRAGILIKGASFIETLEKAEIVVFDKTGTLTKGSFVVSGIHHNKIEEEKLLEYSALAEYASCHPIAKSLQTAYGGTLDAGRVKEVEEYSGGGVVATVDGKRVAVGNKNLMDRLGIKVIECRHAGTVAHIAIDGEYAGHILVADEIKPESKPAVETLRKLLIKRVVMLTGDLKKNAENVAAELGIDESFSELLPTDKVGILEKLLADKSKKGSLIFVGDGINDAPSLARADAGVAMGALGSDAAIEAADIVLMDDNPLKVAKAVSISRKCMRIVKENIVFALLIKLVFLLFATLGVTNLWFAIFADVGVMLLAVLNSIRAMY